MASLAELPLKYRLLMRIYRYRSVDWRPGANLKKPLSEARIAAITTAAYHTPDQPPFDESVRGGDVSFRMIHIVMAALKMLSVEVSGPLLRVFANQIADTVSCDLPHNLSCLAER